MDRRVRTVVWALGIAALVAGGTLVAPAGPLDPPAGPVASTGKTLSEIEPRTAVNTTNTPGDSFALFKITQPGSYYLTANITGLSGKHGIVISANDVTLDLSGFEMLGVPGSQDGVTMALSKNHIAVVNGSVRNWGGNCVSLGAADNGRVSDLRVSGAGGNGVATGAYTIVANCSIQNCAGDGITTGAGCTISDCTSNSNTGKGIGTSSGCTISCCATLSNGDAGIFAGVGSTVIGCTGFANNIGIRTFDGGMIVDCAARFNTTDGIVVEDNCTVRGNTCSQNGSGGSGAGIHVVNFGGNRIEGNLCTDADRGIDVDVAGNIIIRNTCSRNTTDWTIVANNIFGPIIDQRTPGTAAVSGFAAAGTLGSGEGNANFSY